MRPLTDAGEAFARLAALPMQAASNFHKIRFRRGVGLMFMLKN
jgi:hypothetical protein